MNEQLQQTLSEVLIGAVESVGQAKEFVLAELPDVASQALMYHGIISFLGFLLGVGLGIITTLGIRRAIKVGNEDSYSDAVLAWSLGSLITGVATIAVIVGNMEWLKVWLAPKIWLIEYASTLIK